MQNPETVVNKLVSLMLVIILSFWGSADADQSSWDCPECGRTGNTGNYCGGCAHPAPWAEPEKNMDITQDFSTIGSIVTFGHYEQDNNMGNGAEEIEWIVLGYDKANHKALLISRYGLDAKPYNDNYSNVAWETCTLRTWLNNDFIGEAFNETEQSEIVITDVDNSSSQGYSEWSTEGYNNTQDKIFLLSYAEANRYLNVTVKDRDNKIARTTPTAYAIAQGARVYDRYLTVDGMPAGPWWLRSPCHYRYYDYAGLVSWEGSLSFEDIPGFADGENVVRPVLWVNLESWIF